MANEQMTKENILDMPEKDPSRPPEALTRPLPTGQRGRPKGRKDSPGVKRVRMPYYRKVGKSRPPEVVLQLKEEILAIIDLGVAETLADAARKAGVSPSEAWSWASTDEKFMRRYQQAREVVADRIEAELLQSNNVIAQIFMLKGLRPQYRDNYKLTVTDDRTKAILEELRRLAKEQEPAPLPEPTPPTDDSSATSPWPLVIESAVPTPKPE